PGQFLRLTISDTGHGMSHDVKERIFDPFFTTKGEGEGTGMGLSVVHGIIRSLGGTIVVHSEPDKGSTFSVYLPIHDRQQVKQEEQEGIIARGKEHIVFVDDEEFIVDIARQMLEMLGYSGSAKPTVERPLPISRSMPKKLIWLSPILPCRT
ncbi:MAG: hybrid sensor histidine kinase/response regulator, partial [Desulfobacterales bacterium]